MANDVTLKVGADTSGLQKSFGAVSKQIAGIAATVATAFAGKKVIDAAVQQENAINSLNQALIRSGDFSREASQDLQQFASDLQDVSTVGDETTLELLALAKSFGVSNEAAKELVKTSVDASVALGIDQRTALEQLGGTLSGTQGRLAKFDPEVKELSQEALKSGEAIRIFQRNFQGAATGELNTFQGALTQTTNIIGDFAEEIGFFITKSPAVLSAIKSVGTAFKAAIGFLQNNQGAIREGFAKLVEFIIKGVGLIAKFAIAPLAELFSAIVLALNSVSKAASNAIKSLLKFDLAREVVNNVYIAMLSLADVILENVGGAFAFIGKIAGVELPKATKLVDDVRKKLLDLADVNATEGLIEFVDAFEDVRDTASQTVAGILQNISDSADTIDFDALGQDISKGLTGKIDITPEAKNLGETANEYGKKIAESIQRNASSAAKAFGKSFLDVIVKGTEVQASSQETINQLKIDLENATSIEERRDIEKQITEAQRAQIKAQKDSAFEFTQKLGGFIGDTLLPGAGQFVEAFLALAKDPESFRAFIEGFVEQLPEIIDAIAESIPIIFEVLAENADKIFLALLKGTLKIAEGFLNGLGVTIEVFGRNIANAGADFLRQIGTAGTQFIKNVTESISEAIREILPKGGGVGDLGSFERSDVGKVFSGLGFAEGGIVPGGFPNDTGVANVTSGEMILNSDQQQNLFRLLDRGGMEQNKSQTISVNLVLNEQVLANQILELNQNNQRLA